MRSGRPSRSSSGAARVRALVRKKTCDYNVAEIHLMFGVSAYALKVQYYSVWVRAAGGGMGEPRDAA